MWECVFVHIVACPEEIQSYSRFSLRPVKERTSHVSSLYSSEWTPVSAVKEEHRKHTTFIICLMSGECERLLNVFTGAQPTLHVIIVFPEIGNPSTAINNDCVVLLVSWHTAPRSHMSLVPCLWHISLTLKHNTLHCSLITWHLPMCLSVMRCFMCCSSVWYNRAIYWITSFCHCLLFIHTDHHLVGRNTVV